MTIPNTYVILPTEATGTMKAKGSTWVDGSLDRAHEAYRAMLSASPNSGLVTSKMLEAAARAWPKKTDVGRIASQPAIARIAAVSAEHLPAPLSPLSA